MAGGDFAHLLRSVGFTDDLPPPFVPLRGSSLSDHPFIKWLGDNLNLGNYQNPDDKALAAELDNNVAKNLGGDESFNERLGWTFSDVAAATDQDASALLLKISCTASAAAWLVDDSTASLQARTAELREEQLLLQSQVKELQSLSGHLDSGLQASRTVLQAQYVCSAQGAVQLGADQASSHELNAQLNRRLEALQVGRPSGTGMQSRDHGIACIHACMHAVACV